jgi:hypothetical protein
MLMLMLNNMIPVPIHGGGSGCDTSDPKCVGTIVGSIVGAVVVACIIVAVYVCIRNGPPSCCRCADTPDEPDEVIEQPV